MEYPDNFAQIGRKPFVLSTGIWSRNDKVFQENASYFYIFFTSLYSYDQDLPWVTVLEIQQQQFNRKLFSTTAL